MPMPTRVIVFSRSGCDHDEYGWGLSAAPPPTWSRKPSPQDAAAARPIPRRRPAPVTIATLPSSAPMLALAPSALRDEDQFSRRVPGLEVAMRLGRLGEREGPSDVQLEPALAHQGEAALRAVARLVGEEPGDRRHHEPTDLLGLRGQRGDVERIRRAPGAPVENEVPEGREAAQSLLERRLPHRVEDEVDPTVLGQPQHLVG